MLKTKLQNCHGIVSSNILYRMLCCTRSVITGAVPVLECLMFWSMDGLCCSCGHLQDDRHRCNQQNHFNAIPFSSAMQLVYQLLWEKNGSVQNCKRVLFNVSQSL